MFKNYYHVLKISNDASQKEIKEAFRRLAFQNHPDVNKSFDAHEKFIEITEAYEVLKDINKRREYDEIYEKYISYDGRFNGSSRFAESDYGRKYREWQDSGKKKSEEFASTPFDEFAKNIVREVKVGANYLPNLLAVLITVSIAVTIISKSDSVATAAPSLIFFYVTYHLLNVAIKDYKKEKFIYKNYKK